MTTLRILGMTLISSVAVASTQVQAPGDHDETAATAGAEELALHQRLEQLGHDLELVTVRLHEVEARLAASEGAFASSKVVAPFEVVDAAGKPLLRVVAGAHKGGQMTLLNAAGKEVLWASASDQGGFFKTQSSATYPEVSVGSAGSVGGIVIRDAADQMRAGLLFEGGKPVLSLRNDNHVPVLALTQGPSGGGALEIGDATGNGMVRAGITAGGCGRVETYPERPVRATALGVPGDKILGDCR